MPPNMSSSLQSSNHRGQASFTTSALPQISNPPSVKLCSHSSSGFSGTSGVCSCSDSLMIMNCRLGPVPFSNAVGASRDGASRALGEILLCCTKTCDCYTANLCTFGLFRSLQAGVNICLAVNVSEQIEIKMKDTLRK